MNGTLAALGSRASSAARTAASPMAWICVAIPPAAARADELAQPLGLGDPDAAPQLRGERTVGLGLDVGQERRGPRPERAVGEALQPADPGPPVGIGAEHRAAAQTAGQCRVERVVAERGEHPDREPAGLGQARVGRIRPVEVGVRREAARVVDGDDAEAQQLERDRDDGGLEVGLRHRRDVDR